MNISGANSISVSISEELSWQISREYTYANSFDKKKIRHFCLLKLVNITFQQYFSLTTNQHQLKIRH